MEDFNRLSGDDLIALAGLKQSLEIGHPIDIGSVPEHLRFQATRIVTEQNAKEDPIEYGWTLESWREVLAEWKNYSSHFVFGGNRCLRGDTRLYDPVANETRTIKEWADRGKPMHVLSMTTEGVQAVPATSPFLKGVEPLWEVCVAGKKKLHCAAGHKFLTRDGWRPLSQLYAGSEIAVFDDPLCSNSERAHVKFLAGEPRCSKTAPDYQENYCEYYRPCDGQPPREVKSGQSFSPSLDDVLKHTDEHSYRDGPENELRYICQYASHLDSVDAFWGQHSAKVCDVISKYRPEARKAGHAFSTNTEPSDAIYQVFFQSRIGNDVVLDTETEEHYNPGPLMNGCMGEISFAKIISITPDMQAEFFDLTVPVWTNYIAEGVVHANSSKSVLASRLAVWCLMNIPECRVRAYQVNDSKSILEQQAYIWDALPQRLKDLPKKRGATHSITYTQANGFASNKLILPPLPGYERGGECIFGTYQQYRNDPQVVEGFWSHLIWLDEECDQKMYERLLYRIKDADGRIINTFTTIKGWTPLVEDIIGKAKTLKRRHAPLLNRDIPVSQESLKRKSARIYYFWTEDNPFLPKNTMESFKGRSEEEIKATAYGIPTKSALSVFTIFDEDIHVIKHEDIPFMKDDYKGTVTRYQSIDPAGDKPWFWIYAAIDAFNRIIVYDEWPDESYGMWGEPGNTPEGKKGPAQARNNDTIDGYVEKMKFMEGENEIFERIIDARLANTPQQIRDASVTITSELEDAGLVVIPMASQYIQTGLDLIKNALAYDTSKPLGPTNLPRLRISDRCQNVIDAFKNYSNYNGEEVWKDQIDVIRLLLISDPQHVSDKAMQSTGQTWSY